MSAAVPSADSANELQMMDISQSPVKQGRQDVEARTSAAAQPATAGSTKPMLGLAMDGPVSGSADPYWQRLSDLIVQGAIAAEQADELRQVFAEGHYDKWRDRVPAYLLSGNTFTATLMLLQLHCKRVVLDLSLANL